MTPVMNPGRNDRCPCGTGVKFKNCCLDIARQPEDQQLAAARRRISELLPDATWVSFEAGWKDEDKPQHAARREVLLWLSVLVDHPERDDDELVDEIHLDALEDPILGPWLEQTVPPRARPVYGVGVEDSMLIDEFDVAALHNVLREATG